MKILVTGAKGFIGKNLVATLNEIKNGHDHRESMQICDSNEDIQIYEYDIDNEEKELDAYCRDCDFVFNIAGVNRPQNETDFMEGNYGFASALLKKLEANNNKCPVMLSSSIQASLEGRFANSEYGRSKRAGEQLFIEYGKKNNVDVYVYRFANVFGKWCRPNYNSVVATFCNNYANDIPITINDPNVKLDLVYIDDLIEELINAVNGRANREDDGLCYVPVQYETTVGEIADMIKSFTTMQRSLSVPCLSSQLEKKLYSTYLSYLPTNKFKYQLDMKSDDRGSFTEIIKTSDRGQVSVNISKPGITKGNHWHHTKNEKFIVVKGKALIQLRRIGKNDEGYDYPIEEFYVSGDKIEVVEMIPGYTHSIINMSEDEELVTIMWANEIFDENKPDTFYQEV